MSHLQTKITFKVYVRNFFFVIRDSEGKCTACNITVEQKQKPSNTFQPQNTYRKRLKHESRQITVTEAAAPTSTGSAERIKHTYQYFFTLMWANFWLNILTASLVSIENFLFSAGAHCFSVTLPLFVMEIQLFYFFINFIFELDKFQQCH